ncbi:ABC transporter permease [Allorhizocola rhizosphaerae]|uniref:ABC transporter permease n=1 Tax=Allorhizocola rhizosphaerae TaxID=1872709 RepID=UPI000E3D3AFF|nr:ABC transporter permease [Allorhizocola rhizosphaerae]
MSLVITHARYQFLETIRIPIAVIGAMFFPAAAMIFFVVPIVGDNAAAATYATASMVVFATSTTCIFSYGIGVAEDRAQPWDPYVRTLPAGSFPRFAGRILNGTGFLVLSFLPVLVIAAVATEATATPGRLALAAGALLAGSIPFTLLGLTIGYALPSKAALAVAQLLFFPLAFGGGLMSAPGQAPGWLEPISPFLPTRGAAELLWASAGGWQPNTTAVVMLAVWTVVLAVAGAAAYRRDEGRRYR